MHIVKKYFKLVICFSFVLTVLFQILLMNDSVKEKVSTIYRLESQYVYSEQKLPKGNVLIEISSPDSSVYVLQNGEIIADFSKKSKILLRCEKINKETIINVSSCEILPFLALGMFNSQVTFFC